MDALKASTPFFLMAGTNVGHSAVFHQSTEAFIPSDLVGLLQVIESQEHCMEICSAIKAVADELGLCFVFKARCAQSCGKLTQLDMESGLDRKGLSTALTKPTGQAAHHLEDQAWQRG